MAIPTWKVLTAITFGLIAFAVYASLTDLSLGPVDTLVTIALALLFAGVLYVVMRFGYSLGKRVGPDEE